MMNPASQYHEKRFTMHFSICRFKFACLFTALLSAAVLVERPVCGQDPAKQDSEQCFLWKVSSKTTTVYLLGSMHVAKADFFPLPKEVEDAFAKSKILVVELNTEELDQAKLQGLLLKKGIYPPGETLSKKLSKKTMDLLRQYCAKKKLKVETLEPLRPWLVNLTVTVKEIQDLGLTDAGIDKHFLKKAKAENKTTRELETLEGQVELFAGLTPELQEKLLAKTLAESGELKGMLEKMVTAWKAGDPKAMEEIILSAKHHPETKALMEKVFDERNVKMVEKIDGYLKGSDSCFVVVGAGHLVGEKGIVKLLQDKKYQVEQVKRASVKKNAL